MFVTTNQFSRAFVVIHRHAQRRESLNCLLLTIPAEAEAGNALARYFSSPRKRVLFMVYHPMFFTFLLVILLLKMPPNNGAEVLRVS